MGQLSSCPEIVFGLSLSSMDLTTEKPTSPPQTRSKPPIWINSFVILGILGLCFGHGLLCLAPFGGWKFFNHGFSDQPLLMGKHPLHLYHSVLGAKGLLSRGSSTCIDPFFHAGYPKTPVFDSDSRMPERVLFLAWRFFPPDDPQDATEDDTGAPTPWVSPKDFAFATQVYLAQYLVAGLCVPLLFLGISWAFKRDGPTALCLLFLGLVIWWSPLARDVEQHGNGVWLYGGLLMALCHALLARYNQGPSLAIWAIWTVTGSFLILIQPTYAVLAIPFFLGYTMRVGPKHPWLWHLGLFLGVLFPLVMQWNWLEDWVRYWWIRRAASLTIVRPGAEWLENWSNLVRPWEPSSAFPLGLIGFLFVVGWIQLHLSGARALGRAFGGPVLGFLTLVGLGFLWEPARRLETEGLFFAAIWFALYPAARGLLSTITGKWRETDRDYFVLKLSMALPGIALVALVLTMAGPGLWSPSRFTKGPDFENAAMQKKFNGVVEGLTKLPLTGGRILWEEADAKTPEDSHSYSPLLPLVTGHSFMGGLESSELIEHFGSGLVQGRLAGVAIETISDRDLNNYFITFNIGWIVCSSDEAIKRLTSLPKVVREGQIGGRPLFRLDRTASFVLRGQADLVSASPEGIILGNLRPEDGQIVLSFHYHSRWEAIPSRVIVERELDQWDSIPLVRLKLDGPASRVVLRYKRN